ncbi:MAG: Gfo/Idh/MocA family oxidoreductase [Candidatus Brocadiaceae bacterium]|jgi:predicted dehydrogenase
MDEVRVGIVGMGIGRPNGRAIAGNPRGRVVALCDLVEERMDEFAEELPEPVTKYTDYEQMCGDEAVDAVFVGTPNQLHVPVAMAAVQNGKHVLVTKPLADGLEPARELVQAAESAGVVNMMSLSLRFSGAVQYLGRAAREGEFGEFYYARARSMRRSGIPYWNLGFIQKGGGAFRDMGVHVLDAAWWIMGTPRPVTVSGVAGARLGPEGKGYWDFTTPPERVYSQFAADDYAGGLIRFEDGSALQVESFWACHQPAGGIQIELFGTDAGARLHPLTIYRTERGAPQDARIDLPEGGGGPLQNVEKERPLYPGSWDAIAAHFIECVLDGTECAAPLRHGLFVQEMLEALLASGERGREVHIGQV